MIKNRATRGIVALLAAAALAGLGASCATAVKDYNVSIGTVAGGTVASDLASGAEGDTITLTVAAAAGRQLAAGALKVNDGAVALTAVDLKTFTFKMPAKDAAVTAAFTAGPAYDFEAGATTGITSNRGYQNTMAGAAFAVSAEAAQTDTGYKLYTIGAADGDNVVGDWNATGLDLGTKDLAFEFGSNTASGHVVLSFKDADFGSFTGKTGLTFTVKLASIPAAGGIGIMPHLRYNNGTSENAVVFAREVWAWPLADDAFFTFRIPFSVMTKPGYSDANAYTTVAGAVAGGVAFNQLDLDIRYASPDSGALNVVNTGYIDNVELY